METAALSGAMHLLVALGLPLLAGVCGAGLVAAVLQAITSIEDHSIAIISRIVGLAVALVFFAIPISQKLMAYADKIWGSSEYFY